MLRSLLSCQNNLACKELIKYYNALPNSDSFPGNFSLFSGQHEQQLLEGSLNKTAYILAKQEVSTLDQQLSNISPEDGGRLFL
jgi:hypothetical protein